MTGMKLGSLFDGSGGFPLAGVLHGVEPVWASEIEPYPVRVTTARFPAMKHLGDVTKIDGAAIEPVDIITFGSPCQDLSVAGKQAGLRKGERSNLFFEAIRIIKEMRESTNGIYPRIAVWENVPGAYSSNKGADFQAVLQAFCSVKDETADVPRPAAGKWNPAGAIVGNGWSIAWRTFDAQYWGVPQRRKRIYLIADFGSERAGEILFEQESVRGDSAESGKAGEGTAGYAEGSPGRSCKCLTPDDVQSRRVYTEDGVWPSLYGGEGGGHGYVLRQSASGNAASEGQAVAYSVDCRNYRTTKEHGTLQAKENGGQSLNYMGAVCYALDSVSSNSMKSSNPHSGFHAEIVAKTLQAGGVDPTCNQGGNVIVEAVIQPGRKQRKYIIRRLTPLECARLQGFPDYWCSDLGIDNPTEEDISFWSDVWETHRKIIGKSSKPKTRKQIIKWLNNPHSDSAEYKMWGNGVALPNAAHVVGCAVKLIKEAQT